MYKGRIYWGLFVLCFIEIITNTLICLHKAFPVTKIDWTGKYSNNIKSYLSFDDRIQTVSIHVLHDSCLIFIVTTRRWGMEAFNLVGLRKSVKRRMSVRHLWGDVWGVSCIGEDLLEKLTRKRLVAPFLFCRLPRHLVLHEFLPWGLWICMGGREVGELLNPLTCLGNVFICIFSGLWGKESVTFIRFLRGSLIQRSEWPVQ